MAWDFPRNLFLSEENVMVIVTSNFPDAIEWESVDQILERLLQKLEGLFIYLNADFESWTILLERILRMSYDGREWLHCGIGNVIEPRRMEVLCGQVANYVDSKDVLFKERAQYIVKVLLTTIVDIYWRHAILQALSGTQFAGMTEYQALIKETGKLCSPREWPTHIERPVFTIYRCCDSEGNLFPSDCEFFSSLSVPNTMAHDQLYCADRSCVVFALIRHLTGVIALMTAGKHANTWSLMWMICLEWRSNLVRSSLVAATIRFLRDALLSESVSISRSNPNNTLTATNTWPFMMDTGKWIGVGVIRRREPLREWSPEITSDAEITSEGNDTKERKAMNEDQAAGELDFLPTDAVDEPDIVVSDETMPAWGVGRRRWFSKPTSSLVTYVLRYAPAAYAGVSRYADISSTEEALDATGPFRWRIDAELETEFTERPTYSREMDGVFYNLGTIYDCP
ncbi:hypothetical protein EW145_g6775 [Phellinidium pouzarii]|uniref:Uncharacterized protein n=1 Tax=Phellinidium pouzarii TaxID=167371 RepID=A0A4S4KVZ2_9AGAM|nr:hypothetical protein EW145_g6775 [Phellinidium pouzarii]